MKIAKEQAEAVKEEIAETKKAAESAVAKNPEPAKFIGVSSKMIEQQHEETIEDIDSQILQLTKRKEALKKQKSSVKVEARK